MNKQKMNEEKINAVNKIVMIISYIFIFYIILTGLTIDNVYLKYVACFCLGSVFAIILRKVPNEQRFY